jgi:phosphate transport system permease protein
MSKGYVRELGGCAAAAVATVWLTFTLVGVSAPFGLFVCSLLVFFVYFGVVSWRLHGVLQMKDRLGTLAVCTGAMAALVPLVVIIGDVVAKGAPVALAQFPHFFTADFSQGGGLEPVTSVGAGAAIVGTIEQVAIATVLSVPIALLTATYLQEGNGVLARIVRNVVDAMSGTPSIIAGLFVYLLWVAPHKHSGKTGLAAGAALFIMMLPVVTRAAQEVIRVVPGSLREAALALGAPQWRVILQIVLPTARTGLITAAILGVARTAGETAEVLFTAGGNSHYNWNPFNGQQSDLPLQIYQLIFQGSVNAVREAWAIAFVLLLVIFSLFTLARAVGSPRRRGRSLRNRLEGKK